MQLTSAHKSSPLVRGKESGLHGESHLPNENLTCLCYSMNPHDSPVFLYIPALPPQAAFRLGVTTPAVMSSLIVPVLLRGLADPLPNVRLTAGRVTDDVLSVAAMSSWPSPGGRSRGRCHASGRGDTAATIAADEEAETAAITEEGSADIVDGAVDLHGTGDDGDGARAGGDRGEVKDGDDDGHDSGGEWWGCGWEEVELRLEDLSRGDPDRDVAFFAAQALKPKWPGDVRRP